MLPNIPVFVSAVFILTTLTTLVLFYILIRNSSTKTNLILTALCLWLLVTGILAVNGYFSELSVMPPRLMYGVGIPILAILLVFITRSGREFTDKLPLSGLTYIHFVRVPAELVLFWLYGYKAVPELMTFEGRNFDIIAGLSAPIIAYLIFTRKSLGRKALLIWNLICLGLLLNIVINAVLSAPFPFQKFAFDQPNIGVLYFPFVWLPVFIVPVVLYAQLASIRQLLK